MKYYAQFCANNNTSWMQPKEFTNKRKAIAYTRDICKSNVFVGSSGWVSVEDETGYKVYSGKVRN